MIRILETGLQRYRPNSNREIQILELSGSAQEIIYEVSHFV